MKPHRIRSVAAALVAVAAGAACGSAGAQTTSQTSPQPAPPPAQQSNPASVAQARADSARHPWTAADAQFMTHMIGHHAQAIIMANWAPTHDASPSIRILAARIINAQQDEIATMQQWLRDRGQPVPEVSAAGTVSMAMAGMQHDARMPGMLTDAQMAELDRARGKDFDRLFLTYMIQHHRGATSMVTELFGTYGAGQDETVFKFASDVNVDQTTEIARMQRMLAAVVFGPPAP